MAVPLSLAVAGADVKMVQAGRDADTFLVLRP